ncbi:hypothetical protein ACHAXN_005220 [Cyclotella atomus]
MMKDSPPSTTTPAETPDDHNNNQPLVLSLSSTHDSFPDSHDFTTQLQELTKIVSPKVSELLSEQALVLDSYLDGFSDDDDDDDSYDGNLANEKIDSVKKKKKNESYDDEDGMDDEWRRLEGAQNDLRNELALASGLSAFMMGDGASSDDGSCCEEDVGANYYDENQSSSQCVSRGRLHEASSGANGADASQQRAPYTLSDHAKALGVVRPGTDRGLFSRPLLSTRDLQSLNLVTLPDWISTTTTTAPRDHSQSSPQPNNTNNVQSSQIQTYLQKIQSFTTEYIEPPKTKTLRKLYSGWNPGPGERSPHDGNTRHPITGEDANRITSFANHTTDNDDSSVDDQEEEEGDDAFYLDVDGVAPIASSVKKRQSVPVRTATIRIRPDVLCGSVMGSITDSVERLGGDMVKRQGGHLRAILPGRKMRVWMSGEREKAKRDGFVQEEEFHNLQSTTQDVITSGGCASDESSVATGIASMLFSSPKPTKGPKYVNLPPYLIDAQLVTKKLGKTCQRLLLVRVYRIQDCVGVEEDEEEEILDVPVPLDGCDADNTTTDLELECEKSVRALREAAALVQRMKAVGGQGFAIHPSSSFDDDNATVASHGSTKSYLKSFGDAITSPIRYLSSPTPTYSGKSDRYRKVMPVAERMSVELLKKCKSSPSVGMASLSAYNAAKIKSCGVFPSLSREDSPYVKASWIFLRECIREFDQRCLSYSSLATNPLFQFPALPTLDAHFIFQIKLMCRESMIISLVKTASELEVYAREFEVSCSNLDQLLRPTFEHYKIEPPPLPTPLPLTAYPLDFQPPEDITPPWGSEVAKAIEEISKENPDQNGSKSSFDQAEEAVLITVCAFHRQNDIEQGARLGRKNMQVMDRLAKMQAHKRNSIERIKNSYGSNLIATEMADEFHALRLKSSNLGSLSDMMHSVPDQVPLLICNVLVGNAAGTCYVTSSQILFVTQLVPILGGNRIHLFSLLDVDFTINPPSKSMLSPLPAGITLTTTVGRLSKTREEVYSFIPSIGARRFAKFMEVVKDVALEDPNTLKFSERGGLIYMYDENM